MQHIHECQPDRDAKRGRNDMAKGRSTKLSILVDRTLGRPFCSHMCTDGLAAATVKQTYLITGFSNAGLVPTFRRKCPS